MGSGDKGRDLFQGGPRAEDLFDSLCFQFGYIVGRNRPPQDNFGIIYPLLSEMFHYLRRQDHVVAGKTA